MPLIQMFEHGLQPVKGWFATHVVDKTAPLTEELLTRLVAMPAGRVGYIDDAGEIDLVDFTSGFLNTPGAKKFYNEMPLFLIQGGADNDVQSGGYPANNWYVGTPTGRVTGLVPVMGLELQSTEFDAGQTYAPNEPLTADIDNAAPAQGGPLAGRLTNDVSGTPVTPYLHWVCGITSSGGHPDNLSVGVNMAYQDQVMSPSPVVRIAHGIDVLTFWPYFLPAMNPEAMGNWPQSPSPSPQ